MSDFDPESERKRLSALYASKAEEELRLLADQANTLTEPARQALEAELTRRGLPIELRSAAAIEDPPDTLVTVRTFRDVPAALLAKSILESADIECFLYDENIIRMDWLWSNLLGGIKLRVPAEDAEGALQLLDQKIADEFSVEGVGEYKQPRCPQCGSLDISSGESGKRLAYSSVAIGVPLPVPRGGWKCQGCGHSWNDPDEPQDVSTPKPSE